MTQVIKINNYGDKLILNYTGTNYQARYKNTTICTPNAVKLISKIKELFNINVSLSRVTKCCPKELPPTLITRLTMQKANRKLAAKHRPKELTPKQITTLAMQITNRKLAEARVPANISTKRCTNKDILGILDFVPPPPPLDKDLFPKPIPTVPNIDTMLSFKAWDKMHFGEN